MYRQPQVTGPNGSLFGATPISTPSGFSTLPTGAFSLPLGFPQEANPGCLVKPNEFSAWSCKMTFAPVIITINNTIIDSDGNVQQIASTRGGASLDGVIQYGAQTPQLDLQTMQLVQDLDFQNYGPAYHFHTRYDKVVILRSEELNAGSALRKRQSADDLSSRQRFTVQPGDYPWYCYWNDTYIEGYIYATNNSTAANFMAFPTTLSTDSPSSTSPDTATFAAATLAPTSLTTTPPTAPAIVVPTSPAAARRDAAADAAASSRTPPYPRIVKIEERRLPDSPQPYCCGCKSRIQATTNISPPRHYRAAVTRPTRATASGCSSEAIVISQSLLCVRAFCIPQGSGHVIAFISFLLILRHITFRAPWGYTA